jgi:class 3 adenylate cyclase
MDTLRTLTVVKTDIRRFTDRVQQMTAAELDAFLREHRSLIAGVFRRHAGNIVKEIGDSYLVTFESSTNALLASIALQRELALAGRGVQDQLVEIRIGVTAGDVLLQGGDVFGTPVNMVARVEALAPPGEIYFTEAVFQNLNRSEVACEYVGTHPLKGIAEPVRIYRTTFRHQTRTIRNAAAMFTDITGFSNFAETAELSFVERVLDLWEHAHREAVATQAGVIRIVIGDAYVTTFDTAAAGVSAWIDLLRRVQDFNAAPDCPFQISFGAGLAVGDIRVFRSATYGTGLNNASRYCDYGLVNTLTVPAPVASDLPRELRDQVEMHIADARSEPIAARAREAGLEGLMAISIRENVR